MKKQLDSVKEFHEKFKQENGIFPILISKQESELRHKIMVEEVDEYLEATQKDDLVGIADALGDQLYILCGTILKHGMQGIIEKVFDEIHGSNLSKLDENGEPLLRSDGKIIKGPNYCPPNILGIVDPF
jgi:predicted HAD superfamily Cof-like phosphohydrolase